MPGAADIVLRWGSGAAVVEASGELADVSVSEGGSAVVYVDHSDEPMALYASPAIELAEGTPAAIVARVLAGATVDAVVRVTDGNGFVVEVAWPGSGAGAEDVDLTWTRVGIRE